METKPIIKYNKYVIRGNEKLIIPTGDPPPEKEINPEGLKKYQFLKEKMPIKSLSEI